MPTLIHLNGPSGVGKSTLSQRYADDHPGTLNLDADHVVAMIGGWECAFFQTLRPARTLAVAMAESHLRGGHDVVMPQLVTSIDEARSFEQAAVAAGGTYVEVALLVELQEQIERFRSRTPRAPVDRHIHAVIESKGGDELLARIHRDFAEYVAQRPDARRLHTDERSGAATYRELLSILT